MQEKAEPRKIAVIFSEFKYGANIPFARLQQLAEVGLNDEALGFYRQYKENIINLEREENQFNQIIHDLYGRLDYKPDEQQLGYFKLKSDKLTVLRATFPALINQIIDCYEVQVGQSKEHFPSNS
ncbi:MAG: hypothetical protein H0U73_11185 [Tatlockia sp.]|nr:hypothetical protein [Tatlockia sp.]